MAIKKHCNGFGEFSINLSDEDILSAMKSIQGYIDITPADFNEIYGIACRYAFERLSKLVTAVDIMTTEVISVQPDTLLIEAARRIAKNNISGVPVVGEGHIVVGIISEKDYLSKMGATENGSFMDIREKIAKDIMTAPAITAKADNSIFELSQILSDNNINRIPVTTAENQLIGIVTRGDIIDSFYARVFKPKVCA
ncbi:MAG: CBS domain-containing protein [Deltaproteobacteria bacterium]|nr:CBS domain-containing protein [Deltaproteobacteria bacterium]